MIRYAIYPTLIDSFIWYKRINTQEKFQELIDKINRVKGVIPPVAQKGIDFEKCVNDVIAGSSPLLYQFKPDLVSRMAIKLKNATKKQEYIEAVHDGIKLYGFVDYTYPKKYVDLKTTGNYSPGKFADNNQHGCYSLISKIKQRPIEEFIYYVTDFENTYTEVYECGQDIHDQFLMNLDDFIQFLENNKQLITDKKIFGK